GRRARRGTADGRHLRSLGRKRRADPRRAARDLPDRRAHGRGRARPRELAGNSIHAMAGRSLFVAGVQTAGLPGDPQATLERLERSVRALRETFDGLQLVVAPELHLMALPPLLEEDGVVPADLAVDVPGELTERLGALARET